LENKVDAILLPWQPGQEGGNSVADVFWKSSPSGKLTMTFPVKYEDTPSAKKLDWNPAENPTNVTYEEGVYVGYRYFNTFKVSYEFIDYRTLHLIFQILNCSKTFSSKKLL
jgi:beta-glucosidase